VALTVLNDSITQLIINASMRLHLICSPTAAQRCLSMDNISNGGCLESFVNLFTFPSTWLQDLTHWPTYTDSCASMAPVQLPCTSRYRPSAVSQRKMDRNY
jgi:hypothetical protein